MNIRLLRKTESLPYNLLLLADPDIRQVKSYVANNNSSIFIGELNHVIISVAVIVLLEDENKIEIRNIAVNESYQGKGFGKQMLNYIQVQGREKALQSVLIGTGNSSVCQLSMYQRYGFEIKEIRYDFFIDNYSDPIWENGIQCKHMIMLEYQF